MTDHPPTLLERTTASTPGWLLLLAGMAITATGFFAEDWSTNHSILWQRDVVQTQARQISQQKANYILFNTALTKEDPILLERLAMTQLRLKPEQIDVPGVSKPILLASNTSSAATPRAKPAYQPQNLPRVIPVEDLLSHPVSHPGVNISQYQAPTSTLLNICSGNSRLVVIASGILCIFAGLISPTGNQDEDDAMPI